MKSIRQSSKVTTLISFTTIDGLALRHVLGTYALEPPFNHVRTRQVSLGKMRHYRSNSVRYPEDQSDRTGLQHSRADPKYEMMGDTGRAELTASLLETRQYIDSSAQYIEIPDPDGGGGMARWYRITASMQ